MSPGRCGNGKQKERGGWDLESCEAYAHRPQSFPPPPPLPSAKNDRLQEGGENVVEGKDEFGDLDKTCPGPQTHPYRSIPSRGFPLPIHKFPLILPPTFVNFLSK